MKSLWKLPEPWTRRARAHRSLENYRTVFHELPQAYQQGDISNELRTGTFLTSLDMFVETELSEVPPEGYGAEERI